MTLSLTQAAALLGKTPRQVRYMIKRGRLRATKENGRWLIERDDLPLSEGQLRARERKAREIEGTVLDALGPHLRPGAKRRYSVLELSAFSHGREVHAGLMRAVGAEHEATRAIEDSLVRVSQGCHRFHEGEKLEAYSNAREAAARAVALLLLSEHSDAVAISDRVEQDVLPALAGLIRRYERRARR